MKNGFEKFSNPQLAWTLWALVLMSTLLFISLEWNALSILQIVFPLGMVALVVSVTAIRLSKGRGDDSSPDEG